VLRAFRRAGIDADRQRGPLVHGLRHTFATDLATTCWVSIGSACPPAGEISFVPARHSQ